MDSDSDKEETQNSLSIYGDTKKEITQDQPSQQKTFNNQILFTPINTVAITEQNQKRKPEQTKLHSSVNKKSQISHDKNSQNSLSNYEGTKKPITKNQPSQQKTFYSQMLFTPTNTFSNPYQQQQHKPEQVKLNYQVNSQSQISHEKKSCGGTKKPKTQDSLSQQKTFYSQMLFTPINIFSNPYQQQQHKPEQAKLNYPVIKQSQIPLHKNSSLLTDSIRAEIQHVEKVKSNINDILPSQQVMMSNNNNNDNSSSKSNVGFSGLNNLGITLESKVEMKLDQIFTNNKWVPQKMLKELTDKLNHSLSRLDLKQIKKDISEYCIPKFEEQALEYMKTLYEEMLPRESKFIQNNDVISIEEILDQKNCNEIIETIKKNKWIKPKFIDDFMVDLIKSFNNLDWQSIQQLVDDACIVQHKEDIEFYFKEKMEQIKDQIQEKKINETHIKIILSEMVNNCWIELILAPEFSKELLRILKNNEGFHELVKKYCAKENENKVITFLNKKLELLNAEKRKQQLINSFKKEVEREVKDRNLIKKELRAEFIESVCTGFSSQNKNLIDTAISKLALLQNQNTLKYYLSQQFSKFTEQLQKQNTFNKQTILEKVQQNNWILPRYQNQFIDDIYPNLENQNWSKVQETITEYSDDEYQTVLLQYLKFLRNSNSNVDSNNQCESKEQQSSSYLKLMKLKQNIFQNKWIPEAYIDEYIANISEFFHSKDFDKIQSKTSEYCTQKQMSGLLSFIKNDLNCDQIIDKNQKEYDLFKNRLKNVLETNPWIQKHFYDTFHKEVFQGIACQNWQKVQQQIDDSCLPKYQQALRKYLLDEFDMYKEQCQNNQLSIELSKINVLQSKSHLELKKMIQQLRLDGFKQIENNDLIKEVFKIEQLSPFIYQKDPTLVQLYLKKYSTIRLKKKQVEVLLTSGFDQFGPLSEEFPQEDIILFESELSKQSFQTYISSLMNLNFKQRLTSLLEGLRQSYQNVEMTINRYLFSETFKKDIQSQLKLDSNYQLESEIFFSKDRYQHFYIKCISLIEERNLSNNSKIQKTLSFLKSIKNNPQQIIDSIFIQKPNQAYQILLDQIISSHKSAKINQFVLDFLELITEDYYVQSYFTKKLFFETLKSSQIAEEDILELFNQFSNHGLTYFYQSDHIDQIADVSRKIQENVFLQNVYGKEYFPKYLKNKETYFDIQKGKKQQLEYDNMFYRKDKINLEQFMKYDSRDYQPINTQISQSIEYMLNNNHQAFSEIIINLMIQLSKRNQDLSPIFLELKSQLLSKGFTKYDINKKIVTEYLFRLVDDEVRQKMIYLIGYSNPIPFVISRISKENEKIEQCFMKDALWLLSKNDVSVASLGFGYVRGKSSFLNDVFITNFDISNKSFIYQGSADIQSNKIFKTNKRDYFVVDFHGDCLDVEDKYLQGVYNFKIIQISHSFFLTNFQKVINKVDQKQCLSNNICYIIRDFSEAKPQYQEYFNIEAVRQKLGHNYFKNKQVFLLPNFSRVTAVGDKAYLIEKSREFLDSLIKKCIVNCKENTPCRQLFLNDLHILEQTDEQYKIHLLIKNQLEIINKQLEQDRSKGLFVLYPMFSQFQKTLLKLTHKHYLQKRSEEIVFEDTDLDKSFFKYKTMFEQYQVNQRSVASKVFENIIGSPQNLYNTMALFIKDLKLINDFQIQNLIQEKRFIQKQIGTLQKEKNQIEHQIDMKERITKFKRQIEKIELLIEEKSLSVELFWRELIQYSQKDKSYSHNNQILQQYRRCIKKGFPFEIIDGDNFYFAQNFLKEVFSGEEFKDKRICIISIIGPQNSGKSTLLNYLFGCDFNVSDGRCTKGIYGTIIESNIPEFDLILVIDSEGLQSLEKNDPEYDRKITLFCLTVSHLVIINVKDQFQADMLQLLEVCISARQIIQSNTIYQPIIEIIFNQTADPDLDNAQKAIDNAMQSLEKNQLLQEIQTSNQNVTSLPSSITSQLVTVGANQEQWRYLKTQVDFVERVNKLGVKIIKKLQDTLQDKAEKKCLDEWIELAYCIYETIKVHPNLTAFKDIKEKQIVEKITKYIQLEIDSKFNSEFYAILVSETNKKTKEESKHFLFKACEKIKKEIISGYERICKTIDFDIGDLIQVYRNSIIVSIDSKYNNYFNNIVIQKNKDQIQRSLDHCKYGVQNKMIELKMQGASSDKAREEYQTIINSQLEIIKNGLPKQSQINLDILQFITDQYYRYYPHEIVNLLGQRFQDIISQDKETIEQCLNYKLSEIARQNNIFYQSQNDLINFNFTNESFLEHIMKLQVSIVNYQQIQQYYDILKSLINIALSKSMKLICFVTEKQKKQNKHSFASQTNVQSYQGLSYQYSQNVLTTVDQNQTSFEFDEQNIQSYNKTLQILQIKIDPVFIKSQVQSNISQLDDKQKLIMRGKEEFIEILELNHVNGKEINSLQTKFDINIRNNGFLIGALKQLKDKIHQPEKKAKQQIQYWKPFTQWVRKKLQNSEADIINIHKLINSIQANIKEKIKDKQVDEELIQSIQGYVNNEIKSIENHLEIFNIKFSKNFNSFVHCLALIQLYFQEQRKREEEMLKPIQEFYNQQNELLELFMQKYDAQDDLNKISAIEFKDFLYEQSHRSTQRMIQFELKSIKSDNEKKISKYSLQQEIEQNLITFTIDQANKYLNSPQELIKERLNSRLQEQKVSLKQQQQLKISDIISAVKEINSKLKEFSNDIYNQLHNNFQQISYNSVFQTIEIQSGGQFLTQGQREVYQSKAFAKFIFKTLIKQYLNQSDITIDQTKFKIKLNQSRLINIQQKYFYLIEELLNNDTINKLLISDLKSFSQSFDELSMDLIQKIQSINILKEDEVEKSFNQIEERILNQCNVRCPCCDQSCDQDHWKHQGIPIGQGLNKHTSKVGHRYVAFKGVKIEKLDVPALIICHDYQDDNVIVNNNQRMSWKEFKLKHDDWDWKFTNQEQIADRAKWSYLWDLVGRSICQQYDIKNYRAHMNLEEIQNCLKTPNSHFIFLFDESGSMTGSKFESLQASLKSFINERLNLNHNSYQDSCSLIGFNTTTTIHAEYELITPQLLNKIPSKNSGGRTSFKCAIDQLINLLSQKREYDGNIIVAFLSDGKGHYPEYELEKLISEYPNKIKQFLLVGFGDRSFSELIQMETKLKDKFGGKFIKTLSQEELIQSFSSLAFIIPGYTQKVQINNNNNNIQKVDK